MKFKRNEKVSVIVPVYGEEDYIDECVASIVNQTYTDLEIILVDDGSPDRCPQICDSWAEKDSRIKVIHKQNGGLVSARQAGMKVSTGRYIGYVDGDDWIEPDYYEKMVSRIQRDGSDVVINGFQKDLFGRNITCLNAIDAGVYHREKLENSIFPIMMCQKNRFEYGLYTYVWNKLFKREIVYKSQLNVDQRIVIGEDSACIYPAILNANSISISEDNGYHYRQRANSLLRTVEKKNDAIEKLHIFYTYMDKEFSKTVFCEVMKPQLQDFYISHLIMMSDNLVIRYPQLGQNFPFMNVEQGSKIIIYSAGAYGIHIHQQFINCNHYEVVAWADPDYEQYIGSDIEICSLDAALKKDYDYIIVASADYNFIEDTVQVLNEMQVDKKKVSTLKENIQIARMKLEKIVMVQNEK